MFTDAHARAERELLEDDRGRSEREAQDHLREDGQHRTSRSTRAWPSSTPAASSTCSRSPTHVREPPRARPQAGPSSFREPSRLAAMPDYRYLIVGGGMTADAACRGIREHDADGSIGVVGAEAFPPYKRPPLSKALWKGDDEDSIWLGTADLGVELSLGRAHRRRSTSTRARRPTTRASRTATSACCSRPAAGRRGVAGLGRRRRLLPHARRLPRAARAGRRGQALHRDRRRLHRLGDRRGARDERLRGDARLPRGRDRRAALPRRARRRSSPTTTASRASRCSPARPVASVEGTRVTTEERPRARGGRRRRRPRDRAGDRARGRGRACEVDDGIVVDEHGRAGGRDDVFAAGDVARFPAPALGGDMRVEHEDHANSHGRAVGAEHGRRRTSRTATCRSSTPTCSSSATRRSARSTRATRRSPSGRSRTAHGVVCYVDAERRPRGFLLWDVWGRVDDATALIARRRADHGRTRCASCSG